MEEADSESGRDLIYGSWESAVPAWRLTSSPDRVFAHSVGAPIDSLICSALSISPHLQITDLKFASPGKRLPGNDASCDDIIRDAHSDCPNFGLRSPGRRPHVGEPGPPMHSRCVRCISAARSPTSPNFRLRPLSKLSPCTAPAYRRSSRLSHKLAPLHDPNFSRSPTRTRHPRRVFLFQRSVCFRQGRLSVLLLVFARSNLRPVRFGACSGKLHWSLRPLSAPRWRSAG
jgi:hypothetical protein